jgi:hypothetical protein
MSDREKLTQALEERDWLTSDWTQSRLGVSNCSQDFRRLVTVVERIIREDAHALLAGRADETARLIVANLAHKYAMGPPSFPDDPSDRDTTRESAQARPADGEAAP